MILYYSIIHEGVIAIRLSEIFEISSRIMYRYIDSIEFRFNEKV
ncbi:hypothetical protein [Clostridium botulinum]|nr:hypothetical protein [Clostridium botulinum]